ncbi:MAG: FAD-binding protein [Balneola sp.]|nr:MAG: FAD-binding protein [Balneola sp.]
MISTEYDIVVIGSGMGGMSAAALLSNAGYKILILEAALHPGGCSSSYPRKGYIFESGATTLIGFDENQPLWYLEKETGLKIPRKELSPSMSINLDGERITRFKNREKWIEEAIRVFGNPDGQRRFWELAFSLSDIVWRVSLKNTFFPPKSISDWISLFTSNNPLDVWVLKYAFKSVNQLAEHLEVATPKFLRFLDEQLMITAQANSMDTPFLFGAPGLTYTNYSNYYVPGGLIEMIYSIRDFVEQKGGKLHTKEAVTGIEQEGEEYIVKTKKGNSYKVPIVVSNLPIWNMSELSLGEVKSYFEKESQEYDKAWGAITLGIVTTDTYPQNMELHHQIHLSNEETVPFTNSESVFVSMSQKGDEKRAPNGNRTLNVSCHANPEYWFSMNGTYDLNKEEVQKFILQLLSERLPGFKESELKLIHTATPVTWENWVYRKKGRVGGIPQSMARSLLKWSPSQTPFQGLYLVGDTTYPGQGIPGVTLSGINVYSRIVKNYS